MAVGVAVEVSLAGESRPAGEDREGDDLACGKGGLGTGAALLGTVGLAKVIDDDVECGEEGVHVEHESVPFPTAGLGGKLTLRRGHLPLKSSAPKSHQAFKCQSARFSRSSSGRGFPPSVPAGPSHPTRPGLSGSGLYTGPGRALLTPLLAWLRFSYPTSSVALNFAPLKCCAGASVVRSCPSPVG